MREQSCAQTTGSEIARTKPGRRPARRCRTGRAAHPAPVALLLIAALAAGVIWSEDFRAIGHRLIDAVSPAHEQPAAGPVQYYTCGMHPWVVLPKPGVCPICHMKLVPLDPAKFTSQITIDPIMTQNIGVRVAPVVTGPLTAVVRTVGLGRLRRDAAARREPEGLRAGSRNSTSTRPARSSRRTSRCWTSTRRTCTRPRKSTWWPSGKQAAAGAGRSVGGGGNGRRPPGGGAQAARVLRHLGRADPRTWRSPARPPRR